jgi:NADH dehydrogenase
MFMQIAIVIAEILIGLALMGGLLTSLAALVFTGTAADVHGLHRTLFIQLLDAVCRYSHALRAGQIFGLDYYVSPLLKKGCAT